MVCPYCRSVVARGDRGLENLGQVAALIDTGSPLRVGLAGKYRKNGFRITGRTQMRHQAGGVWDEWYAAFDDGRWGWLAEAQGRYYVTFATASDAPPLEQLELGRGVEAVGDLVANEIGTAELASAEGEIPWRAQPGSTYDYADLTGTDGKFATIDYSEDKPLVFSGWETSLAQLGLEDTAARAKKITASRINCPNCGGPLDLRMGEQTERIYCPNCGSALDVAGDKLALLHAAKQKKKIEPIIPLGTEGTVDGIEYVVAGFMERAVDFDVTYYWNEYLLFNHEAGFRWLVHSDDHWSFVHNVPAGEVHDSGSTNAPAKHISYGGKRYRLFQVAEARVTYVLGEFYWKVSVGERAGTADYIAPPHGMSKEVTVSGAREVNYSHAVYMTRKEVQKAFGVEGLARPRMVGPMQPYRGPKLAGAWAMMFAVLCIVAAIVAATRPNRTVLSQAIDIDAEPLVEGAPENTRVVFSEPFELSGRHNVAIEASSAVNNQWAWVGGELVNEKTGVSESFDLPIEYYSGVEDGERWSEGDQAKKVYVAAPAPGTYALRLEAQWEKPHAPAIRVVVREGVFRGSHFLLALLAISIPAALAIWRQIRFEVERWKDSSFSPFPQSEE